MASLISSLRTIPEYINSYYNPAGNFYVLGEADQQDNSDGNVINQAQVVNANKKHWEAHRLSLPRHKWVIIHFSNPLGDVNGDGEVTAADITALYDLMLNEDSSQAVNPDQNGDGETTAADITAVYSFMLEDN